MESENNTYKLKYKYAADYGFILGGYLAVIYFLQYLFRTSAIMNVLTTIGIVCIPLVCFYLTKMYRDKALHGYIRYIQSWSFGIWLFFFAGLIMSVVYFIHFQFLEPDFIANTFNQSLIMLEGMNYPKESLDLLADNGIPSAIQMVVSYLFAYIVGGAMLFLIISPFVTKKDPDDNFNIFKGTGTYEPYKENKDKEDNNDVEEKKDSENANDKPESQS